MFPRKKSRKLLEEVLPLNIIREVEKWPALYSKGCPEWSNAHFRKKMWYEIGKSLFSGWNNYSQEEKEKKVVDLMKKWRNLRDTFKKNYDLEKKTDKGENTQGKKYVYFKYMSFLVPHIAQEESDTAPQAGADEALSEWRGPPAHSTNNWRSEATNATDSPRVNRKMNKSNRLNRSPPRKKTKINNKDLNTLYKLGAEDDIDENKHFLMSLVPYFNKMSDDERLTAKVEILKVIKKIRRGSSCNIDDGEVSGAGTVVSITCQQEIDHLANTVKEEICDSGGSEEQDMNFTENDNDTD